MELRTYVDLGDLPDAIERGTREGLTMLAEATAREARTNHVYQNRTGDLQASTTHVPSEGGDDLVASAVLGEQYASYVDRWAASKTGAGILEWAWERVQSGAVAEFERTLIEAVTRA